MHTTAQKLEPVAIRDLRPSKTNPRKHFNESSLQELADSIRTQGIRQPILARPKPGETSYEIVAGERRYRAAQLAGLDLVPCLLQEMSDREALEVQVVENLQRSDLTELEEAQSYQSMLDLRDGDAPCYTVAALAQRFGISESKIYQRLKLLDVPEEGRKALEEGKLGARQLVLIGRIPDPAARADALEKVLRPKYSQEPLTYKETEELIGRDYMQGLKGAPFKLDDADLVPAAGACATCPKMTDNCAHLFGPEEAEQFKKKKVCTDPACFRAKLDAVWKKRTEAAEAEGAVILSEKQSREIFPAHVADGDMAYDSPYVFLGDKPAPDLLKPEVVDSVGTWRRLLEDAEKKTAELALAEAKAKIQQDGDLSKEQKREALALLEKNPPSGMTVPRVLARDQRGAAREIVERRLAITAIEAAGEPLFMGKVGSRPTSGSDEFAKQRKKELEAAQLRTAEAIEGMAQMHAALVKIWQPSPVWESLFEIAMGHAGADGLWLIGKWQGLKFGTHNTGKEEAVAKWAGELPPAERQALVPLLLIGQQMKWSGLSEGFEQISHGASLGLDVDAIARAVKDRIKGEKQAKKEKAVAPKPPKAKKLSKKEQLATDAAAFGWNEAGVATVPQRHSTTGKLPKGVKCEITAALAPDGKWRYGYDLQSRTQGKAGRSGLPSLAGEKFKTAEEARVAGFTLAALPFFHDDPAVLRVVALDADPKDAAVVFEQIAATPGQIAERSVEELAQWVQAYTDGMPVEEIARSYRAPVEEVKGALEVGRVLPPASLVPGAADLAPAVVQELLRYDDEARSLEEMAYLTHLPKDTVRAALRAAGREQLGCEAEDSASARDDARQKLQTAFDETLPGCSTSARATILGKYIKRVCGSIKPEEELTPAECLKIVDILAQARVGRGATKGKVTTASEQEAA